MTTDQPTPGRTAVIACLALLAVALGVATAPTAGARGACTPLLSDARGDATISNPQDSTQLVAVGNDPALDLLRADLTADRRSFTMVVQTDGDMRMSASAGGHSVELVFRALGETTWNLSATFPAVGPIGVRLGMVEQGGSAMPGDATLSADGRTLRATVPIDDFEALAGQPLRKGSRVSGLHLYSNRALAVQNSGVYSPAPADTAGSARTYVVGGASCVA